MILSFCVFGSLGRGFGRQSACRTHTPSRLPPVEPAGRMCPGRLAVGPVAKSWIGVSEAREVRCIAWVMGRAGSRRRPGRAWRNGAGACPRAKPAPRRGASAWPARPRVHQTGRSGTGTVWRHSAGALCSTGR
ncbi:hypothetical protein MBELCI_2643 [Limimaricola cinnabarinus LL-001]|uniref:Uncharacterized protein n=1 Tax=Limimaricola cinnabarinus LL-001 TaxID=1337093 RepID=U2YMX1_9RHOB|nr:hypothetical protein MBELCI_2643 [Limimaricola cinnabarinus LL-001]